MRFSCRRLVIALGAALSMATACAGSAGTIEGHPAPSILSEPPRRDREQGRWVASPLVADLDPEPAGFRATVTQSGPRSASVGSQGAGAAVIALVAVVATAWLLGSRW